MSAISQLERISTKRIDDNQWFDIDAQGSLFLRKRAQTCWEKTCEWFSRTFTYKTYRLKDSFQTIVTDFNLSVAAETDEKKRTDSINSYGEVIQEIFRTAERMKAAKIAGFNDPCKKNALIRGHHIPLPELAYQIQAHLPPAIYALCQSKNLLPTAYVREAVTRLNVGTLKVKFHDDNEEINSNEAYRASLKLKGMEYVDLYYTPADPLDYSYQVGYQNRVPIADAYYTADGTDYVRPPMNTLRWYQVYLCKMQIETKVRDILTNFPIRA